MKRVIIMMLVICFAACKSTEKKLKVESDEDILLTYSKGACLGKCPVYKLEIRKNGMLVYHGFKEVRQKGNVIMQLSSEELSDLMQVLEAVKLTPKDFKKIRDKPVTVLEFEHRKYRYHASMVDSELRSVNSRLEELARQVGR